MESKKTARPVIIRFKDHKEMVDTTIRINLKYFVAKLLFAHYNREV